MTGPIGDLDLPAPTTDRWFEDYVPGSFFDFGHTRLSEQEIIAFAHDHDAQVIHTDPAESAKGPFGGLIASGIYTFAACMRLYVDHYVSQVAGLACGGVDAGKAVDPSPAEPAAGAFEGEDVGVVDNPVDHRGGDGLVAKDTAPARSAGMTRRSVRRPKIGW